MVIISENSYIKVAGTDGGTMLGAFAGIGVIVLVFLVYIRNKGWWWSPVATENCCEEGCPPTSNRHVQVPAKVPTSNSVSSILPPKNKLLKTNSFHGIPGLGSFGGGNGANPPETEVNSGYGWRGPQPGINSGSLYAIRLPPYELVSMVEKGRCVGKASSNSSCCSSEASSAGAQPIHHLDDFIMQRCMADLRETKIDNQSSDYQSVDTFSQIDLDSNGNRDCIVVMNPENDDKDEGNEVVASADEHHHQQEQTRTCGLLEVALLYDAPVRKMTVHVLQARLEHPPPDREQPTHTQVRLLLLPSKKQKHKTKIRYGENPHYMESFVLHRINPEDVNSMGVRLRLYGCERMRRERIVGEAIVSFAKINLELENHFWLNLPPRANTSLLGCTGDLMSLTRSDSTGSRQSMQHGGVPELLLGLSYNATTGRLSVEVVKGSHFSYLMKNIGGISRAPDTYVKLNLVSSTGQELAHGKTTIRRGQPNPLFKEILIFQVALFQLADVTLMVVVYNRKSVTKKKEMLGWFSLGLNSSGAEELAHWMDMKEYQQDQLFRWHVLIQS